MARTISFAGLSASGADAPPAGALPPGIGVGRYEIARLLRHDAYALTYAATDAQDGSDVVIREYLPLQLAARDGSRMVLPRSAEAADHFQWGRERFVSEARRLASLARTPGIVRVRGIVEAHGTVAMVMDPVPGETLDARLAREGRLPPATIEPMLEVLLAGLSRAHANAVLHLDITPQAIVLDEDDRPTLIDFARARLALAARLKSRLLRPGSAYAAPELSGDTRPGPQSDIYGLSATLYHCVAGRPPPPAAARRTMVPAAQAAAGHYTPALLAGIDAGLALKVEDRPPTVGAWRLRLMGDEEFPDEEESAAPPASTHRSLADAAAQLGSAKARLDATASLAASKARESRERLRRRLAARAASAASRFRQGRARLAALPAACRAGLRRAAGALPSPAAMMRAGRDGAAQHRRWLPFAALALLLIAGAAAAAWQVLRPGGIEPGRTIAAGPPAPGDEAARRDAEAKRIAQEQEEAARREAEARAAAEEAARREAEAKRAAEQEAARREAEAKRAAEQEAARRAAEEKARAEAARQQREAEARRAQEEAARRAAEEKARTQAAVQRRQEAEARARAAALRAREAASHAKEAQVRTETAARQQREAEAKRAQEETARREAEEKARAEAARQQRETEAKRAQEEAARREAEEKARAEAARRAAEEKARAEAARQQREAEAKRAQEEAARREAQAKEKTEAQRFAELLDRLESEAAIPEPPAAKPSAPTDPRQAEAAERALRLTPRDRARVQIALSSLGFDTRGVDEVFGPRTRQMIAAWQKKQGAPDTGFLTRQQFATLERTADEALGRYDAEQKRFEEMMRGAAPPQARRQRRAPARPAHWVPPDR